MSAKTTAVIDTSILFAEAALYNVSELRELSPVELVIPFTAVSELDRLVERGGEKRDRARKAMNVIKDLARRGVLRGPVPTGNGIEVRVAGLKEEVPYAGLDMNLADDRILSLALNLSRPGVRVMLAAAEFALYAKAIAAGLEGLHIERFADVMTTVTRRELARLEQTWIRLCGANDTMSGTRRMLQFLRAPLARRLLSQDGVPADLVAKLQALEPAILGQREWPAALQVFGLQLPVTPDLNAKQVFEPTVYRTAATEYAPSHMRPETDQERFTRVAEEERQRRNIDEENVDVILEWMSYAHDWILSRIESEEGEPR